MCANERPAFANLLRSWRVSAGYSQERLAELAGLSVRAVSDLERGERRFPRLGTVRMLADALELGQEDRTALFLAAQPPGDAGQETAQEIPPARTRPALPIALTSLVAREREIDALADVLNDDAHRLVTLVGPGGVGKTHLALEVATRLESSFRDGAFFVGLASVGDPSLVAATIASTLGARESKDIPVEDALVQFLRDRRLLLVLDNFEHVAEAAPMVTRLLSASPGLMVLATSRTPLKLTGEYQYPVSPLSLPDPDLSPSFADVAESGAVRLFMMRAQDVRPDLELTPDTLSDILTICRRLDGLPLALELAAGRTRLLTPRALLGRLERSLPLLTGGAVDLPERQRTLRSTIAWSYDLLAPEAQRVFRQLGVFVGGWTLEAAEAVAMDSDALDVIEAISILVDASLVRVTEDADGEPRYLLWETIREFALEYLEESGEADTVRERHARYCLALAARDAADMSDDAQESWLARLEAERGNIRAALTWLLARRRPLEGLQLTTTLGRFWAMRGGMSEGRTWLESFLALPEAKDLPVERRIAALRWAGDMSHSLQDTEAAQAYLSESVALARRLEDRFGVYDALGAHAAGTLFATGDVAGSIPLFREAIALARDAGDRRAVASMLPPLAYALAHQGDSEPVESMLIETLELAHSYNAVQGIDAAIAILFQGWFALAKGDTSHAVERLDVARAHCRIQHLDLIQTIALAGLGEATLLLGKLQLAAERHREGLAIAWLHHFPMGIAFNLQGLVRLATTHGHPALAARFVGGLRPYDPMLRLLQPAVMRRYASAVDQVRDALGNPGFATEAGKGESSDRELLIREALAFADRLSSTVDA